MALPLLKWVKSPNFSDRHGSRVDLLVLHDTEGNYAGAVNWFQKPESRVSAHFVIKEDGSEVTQMVDICDKAWHACAFNPRSVGFEMAGLAAKGFAEPEWQTAANIIAFHLHHLQIPMRWARGGVGPGFCSHFDLGKSGGGHRDPTTDPATWQRFVSLVDVAYRVGNFPAMWTPEHERTQCGLSPAK
jgi:N-acetylmuramoyl-L-alanine amidase